MPFPYQTSATPVRTREPIRKREKDRERDRDRDRDTRSTTSSSTKKHREASRSSNRSPLPSSSRPTSLYNQTNITLDQLPPLPRSESASPLSTRSPTLRHSTAPATSSNSLSSSAYFPTPAALQPYLETDDDEEFEDAKTPQALPSTQVKPYFDTDPIKVPSRPQSVHQTSAPSPPAPIAPVAKAPSPQNPPTPSTALSRVSTRSSDPTPNLQHPRPYHIPITSPTFAAPALPFFGAPPSEQYFPQHPVAPQYYPPMAQAPGHPMDLQHMPAQNYYQPYGSPQHVQPPHYSQMRSQPVREHSSASSRMSISGDPFQTMGQIPMMPADQGIAPESIPTGALEGEDDAVLKRIQNAIPDLNLLLTRYRQTSGQLGEREVTLRQTEAEKAKVLEQKDSYIEQLSREKHEASQRNQKENERHADEKDKLRLEIGNMTEKHNELQESLHSERRKREDLEYVFQSLGNEHTLLLSRSQEEKAAMARDHENWRAMAKQEAAVKDADFRMKEKEYIEHQQRQTRELDDRSKALSVELSQKHAKEREKSELAWSLRNRELEDIHTRLRRDLEDAKDTHRKTVEEHVKRHSQEKETWIGERESLIKGWEGERVKMGQGSEELISLHQKERRDLQEGWKMTEARLNAEIDKLSTGWKADKEKYKTTAAGMQSVVARLNDENSKLQRFADALEQVTDLRGRGDAF
ncbi:MAG: hypothetical protein Q9186_004108 [Xanthomendoza sp. 1 TL-2023]